MTLHSALTKIFKEYGVASKEKFAGHPLASFLRHALPDNIKRNLTDPDEFLIRGSSGQGNWAKSPWVALFDPQITDTAQRGYYPVYLFREDFSGVYLSLNQGMTEVRESYKSGAKEALQSRAEDFRARLGKTADKFDQITIDLRPSSTSNDSTFYEAGNIVAKFYPVESVPEEAALKTDLHDILRLYKHLIYGDPVLTETQNLEDDEQENKFYENPKQLRVHKRIERNRALAKQVKKLQGYTCKLCGFNYENHYGEIGKEYIEAHHLEPISKLEGRRIERDPKKDFAVLCANCHRMIHRSEFVGDLESFRQKYLLKKI